MKSCPKCESSIVRVYGFWAASVRCDNCGFGGPLAFGQDTAIEKWDALPRGEEVPPVDGLTLTVDDVVYQVHFSYSGPVTFCGIVWQDHGKTVGVYGASVCNPKDEYRRAEGEKRAVRRACCVSELNWRTDPLKRVYSAYRGYLFSRRTPNQEKQA